MNNTRKKQNKNIRSDNTPYSRKTKKTKSFRVQESPEENWDIGNDEPLFIKCDSLTSDQCLCPHCTKIISKFGLEDHVATVHGLSTCCCLTFQKHEDYSNHVSCYHRHKQKFHVCDCGAKFKYLRLFTAHKTSCEDEGDSDDYLLHLSVTRGN